MIRCLAGGLWAGRAVPSAPSLLCSVGRGGGPHHQPGGPTTDLDGGPVRTGSSRTVDSDPASGAGVPQPGQCGRTANQLHAFQNKVRAQVAPIDPELAATFIQAAQEAIDGLQRGGSSALAVKVYGLKHQPDGKAQLGFSSLAGQVHIVEASTNLVHWETIGVASEQADGTFTFDDPNAARFPNRFYRIVST